MKKLSRIVCIIAVLLVLLYGCSAIFGSSEQGTKTPTVSTAEYESQTDSPTVNRIPQATLPPEPTSEPTVEPAPEPSPEPTPEPTVEPTSEPSPEPDKPASSPAVPSPSPTKTTISAPVSNSATEGVYYQDIVDTFKEAGFTNVTSVSYEAEALSSPSYEGYGVYIFIDGDPYFEDSAEFEPDAKVEVAYAVMPEPTPTPEPTPEPTVAPTPEPTPEEPMVWIPTSGSKYHRNSSCSNMKNPTQVTKSEAERRGYDPCKKCY